MNSNRSFANQNSKTIAQYGKNPKIPHSNFYCITNDNLTGKEGMQAVLSVELYY